MGDEPNAIQVPTLVSLLICDQVIDDRLSNKKSAIGLFNAIMVGRMPAMLAQLVVMASLTEIREKAKIELRIMRDRDNEVLFRAEQEIAADSPLATVDLVFALQGIRIPTADQYAAELRCEGEILGRRRFHVYDRTQKRGEQA